jgi:2-polyprenyl-3-methyl-5-hydroxy-6-metoxy-1,4-benzoquinol methylase
MPLRDFPLNKDLLGLGMSDWDGYALPLTQKLGYINAYYHQEPFLDITRPPEDWANKFDFIVTSDVMEHVTPPIQDSFDNLFHLLRPGGLLVLSVPFVRGESTREHYPVLHHFDIFQEHGTWVLRNEAKSGETAIYRDLTFHGGPGSTLEMRVFGLDELLKNLATAGFTEIEVMNTAELKFGIIWNHHNPDEDSYKMPIFGLDAPPIIARRPRN